MDSVLEKSSSITNSLLSFNGLHWTLWESTCDYYIDDIVYSVCTCMHVSCPAVSGHKYAERRIWAEQLHGAATGHWRRQQTTALWVVQHHQNRSDITQAHPLSLHYPACNAHQWTEHDICACKTQHMTSGLSSVWHIAFRCLVCSHS